METCDDLNYVCAHPRYLTVNVAIPDIRITSAPAVSSPLILPSTDQTVTWDAATESVTKYELYRNDRLVYSGNDRSFTLRSDGVGEYEYKVRGCQGDLCGEFSPIRTVTVYSTPSAPSNFRITNTSLVDKNNIALQWNAAEGLISGHYYNLYSTEPGGQEKFLAEVTGTSHTRTVNGIGHHSFRIQACNPGSNCGSSVRLNQIDVKPPEVVGVIGPAEVPLNSTYTVKWDAIDGNVDRYLLMVNEQTTSVGNVLQASVNETGVIGEVRVRVAACNEDSGCGSFSSVSTATVYGKPLAPRNPKINGVLVTSEAPQVTVDNEIELSWIAPVNAISSTTYTIRVRTPDGSELIIAQNIKSLNFKHFVEQVGQYDYRVHACDATLGCTSTFIKLHVVAPDIGTPTLQAPSGLLVVNEPYTINWSGATGSANLYELFEGSTLIYQGSELSFTKTPTVAGNRSYSVRACYRIGICGNQSPLEIVEVFTNAPASFKANDDIFDNISTRYIDLAIPLYVVTNDEGHDPNSVRIFLPSSVSSNGRPISVGVGIRNTITYKTLIGFSGSDSFTYRLINDQNQLSEEATVTVNFTSSSNPPIAIEDSFSLSPTADCNADSTFEDEEDLSRRCTYRFRPLHVGKHAFNRHRYTSHSIRVGRALGLIGTLSYVVRK